MDKGINELCKSLIFSSAETTINIINYLFKESFNQKEVEIIQDDSVLISEDKDKNKLFVILNGPFIEVIEGINNKRHYYNIEFETEYRPDMNFQMFSNLLNFLETKKFENKDISSSKGLVKQLVIYFQEDNNIKDNLCLDFSVVSSFSDGALYKVPVFKFWKCTLETLKNNKLYTLIPLKLLDFRKELEAIQKERNNVELLKGLSKEVLNITKKIIEVSDELYTDKLISKRDFDNMLKATESIFNHLNRIYFYNEMKLDVEDMIKYM